MTHEAARPELGTRFLFPSRPAKNAVLLDAMPREEPGDYDIYLLAQTWSPMFCCKKADR